MSKGETARPPQGSDENEIIRQKREKVQTLRALGIHPYDNTFRPDSVVASFRAAAAELSVDDLERPGKQQRFALAGRLMSLRIMGKLAFGHLKDETGRLQAVFSKEHLGEKFDFLRKFIDIGDIIGVVGEPFVTKTGEMSVLAHEVRLITKNVRPLPEKFHGLTDKELRYRQRYLDLIMNDEVQETFRRRIRIIAFLREWMNRAGFLEVETPMMHPLVSGAAARPFVTHHNALDMQLYLRIAPECYLKRLLVGGMGKVYEINRNFRNEGISVKHNPEFTMMEFYWPYVTYRELMDFTEEMLVALAQEICASTAVTYQGRTIEFAPPWPRLTIEESLVKYGICTVEEVKSAEGLLAAAVRNGLDSDFFGAMSYFKRLVTLFEEKVEEHLWQPTFITRYPAELSPLARRNDEEPAWVDRFELYIAGREIANAFSELNDPQVQYEAFAQQAEERKKGNGEAVDMDADYIRALEYGMPPAGGEGIGIDRLVMILTDAPSIRDVILFPLLRPE